MNERILLLLKVITAAYYNFIAEDDNVNVVEELKEILVEDSNKTNAITGFGNEEEILVSLKETAEWLLYGEYTNLNAKEILQRTYINLSAENKYVNIIDTMIDDKVGKANARNKVVEIMDELRYQKRKESIKKLISKANSDLNFNHNVTDVSGYLRNLTDQIDNVGIHSSRLDSIRTGGVELGNKKGVSELLEDAVALADTKGLLNTGLKAFNRSIGGGIPRGALVNIGARTHNYKSGQLLDLTLNMPRFTDPWMWDDGRKPLILRISFENTIRKDIATLCKRVHARVKNESIHIADLNIRKSALQLKNYTEKRGYHVCMEAFDPDMFSIYDLLAVLEDYYEKGYEIHAVTCDYLSLIANNSGGERFEQKIQKTFEMIRNFCIPKGISFITAHQLNTETNAIAAQNSSRFIHIVKDSAMYMDAKGLKTKLDIELTQHIHKHGDGHSYLMLGVGKLREDVYIPESQRIYSYRFDPILTIPPDVELEEDLSISKLPSLGDVDTDDNEWD